MTTDRICPDRVSFGRGFDVWMMAIDGTWRRHCQLISASAEDAELTFDGSLENLHLKEFFLLLSSTGLAYRRCELIKVNGSEISVKFIGQKFSKKTALKKVENPTPKQD